MEWAGTPGLRGTLTQREIGFCGGLVNSGDGRLLSYNDSCWQPVVVGEIPASEIHH